MGVVSPPKVLEINAVVTGELAGGLMGVCVCVSHLERSNKSPTEIY